MRKSQFVQYFKNFILLSGKIKVSFYLEDDKNAEMALIIKVIKKKQVSK